jgi:hypothetical protein
VGESWWNCENDVWGRVGINVKSIFAICIEFRRINYLSDPPVIFYMHSGLEPACVRSDMSRTFPQKAVGRKVKDISIFKKTATG